MTFVVKEQHRIYKESLRLKSSFGNEIQFKNMTISPIETFFDKYSKKQKQGVQGTFSVTADVFANKEIKSEDYPISLEYQACSDEYCLFPQDFQFKTPLYIKDSSLSLHRILSESLLLALIFVFFAGFLTSFTPCIFPMIPLTLAVLVPRGQNLTFSQKLRRSLSYVFGIALTYSVFGLIAASSGMMFGSFLGNKYVAMSIGFFFVLFAISMLGFFEIKTPRAFTQVSFLKNSNTFFFGLAAGVIAGPCVGPVLLSILTFISQTGNLQTGFLLMMSFAFGMGLIFIILGVAGNLLQVLPRSGTWLSIVKYIFAAMMLALSLYYVWPVLSTSELIYFVLLSLLTLCACYLFFFERVFFRRIDKKTKLVLQTMIALFVIAMVGTFSFSSKLNQKQSLDAGWVEYDEKSFAALLKNGKPTIVDFYADWCVACKELKTVTFRDTQVKDIGQTFNLVIVNATQSSEILEKLKNEHHVLGLPTLLFYNSQGDKKEDLTLTGFEGPTAFIKRMQQAME